MRQCSMCRTYDRWGRYVPEYGSHIIKYKVYLGRQMKRSIYVWWLVPARWRLPKIEPNGIKLGPYAVLFIRVLKWTAVSWWQWWWWINYTVQMNNVINPHWNTGKPFRVVSMSSSTGTHAPCAFGRVPVDAMSPAIWVTEMIKMGQIVGRWKLSIMVCTRRSLYLAVDCLGLMSMVLN